MGLCDEFPLIGGLLGTLGVCEWGCRAVEGVGLVAVGCELAMVISWELATVRGWDR